MTIPMELARIIIREMQDSQIIVLKEIEGDRSFPIVIGTKEAEAIDRRLKGEPQIRPQTHDLLASVIDSLGGELSAIEINKLHKNTFFAKLQLLQNGRTIEVDCRPSDAIALGVTRNVTIMVDEQVLLEAMR